RRQTTKVRISAIGDTIMLKFLQPDMDTRLDGYILGYGSSLFSKQLIELPEDGQPYETEIDAEPKYLVVVQPYKGEEVKKQCTGKETLQKPLHLVIGSVTQNSVMLSWGTLLNALATESNLDDCIKDGHYTVRYREKEPKRTWNYQTCPTSGTVIDQLKPDTPYEFGVRAESRNITGAWSAPVIHNTAAIDIYTPLTPENTLKPTESIAESPQTFTPFVPVRRRLKDVVKRLKPENPLRRKKPITESPQTFPPSVPVLKAVTQSRPASLLRHPKPLPTKRVTQDVHKPRKPEIFLRPETTGTFSYTEGNASSAQHDSEQTSVPPQAHRTSSYTKAPSQSLDGHQTKPVLVSGATNRNQDQDMSSPVASVASTSAPTVTQRVSPISVPNPLRLTPTYSNTSAKNPQGISGKMNIPSSFSPSSDELVDSSHDEKYKGQLWNKRKKWNRKKIESTKNQLNQVDNVEDKVISLKVVEPLPIPKPSTPPNTSEIYQKTTPTSTLFFAYNGSRYNMGDNSSVFSSLPISDLDSKGRKRYVAPHVVYQDKPPEKPCSVTHALSYFPDEENMVTNITGPPKTAPSNVTVVTVEGCPSFVIIDWEKTDNETTGKI
ncbi:hypothetical protein QTP86_019577, partial [Hemibagrus guttatus]